MVYEHGHLTLHDICQNIGHHGIIIMVLFFYHGIMKELFITMVSPHIFVKVR